MWEEGRGIWGSMGRYGEVCLGCGKSFGKSVGVGGEVRRSVGRDGGCGKMLGGSVKKCGER